MKKNVFVLAALALLLVRPALSETYEDPAAAQTMAEAIARASAAQRATTTQPTGAFQAVMKDDDDGDDDDGLAEYEEYAAKAAKDAASGSIFSSCTPNPFKLCSGPRPSKKHKALRRCWNAVCP